MTIPTPSSRRASSRRLDRTNRQLEHARHEAVSIVEEMRQGAVLRLCQGPRTSTWVLSTGRAVQSVVALFVINDPHVIGAGDALFADTPSQTYRYV